ncbi:DUF5694 domain-containing protein [Fulvivirga ligni]|uniref:DUF5694 domain-containing protein n=1 Tax=Fulvivirga ligni TaxID=2904246 RepID=UPI001F2DDA5D|nr:DUF5694 domain-containing protein [Fulvivirga ligni]UII21018.1 DUF5694 domain-containing protein [Fulvivirga ligni]
MQKVILLLTALFISSASFGQKIKVLNFGTFHMGGTTDAHKVDFDEANKKNKEETYKIATMLAEFKPTVICVEVVPSESEGINKDYQAYLKDPKHKANYFGEIALIAYPLGKLSRVKTIYGIDEQTTAPYNYNIGNELQNQVDSTTSQEYFDMVIKEFYSSDSLSTLDKLRYYNTQDFWDKSININADMLTHSSTPGHFEGADEAAKFYRRNLRIYSNLNQIPLTEKDRVFIIMGNTHTAFLNEFLKRSPKYELVEVQDYLK